MKKLTDAEFNALLDKNPDLHSFDDEEIGLHVVFRCPNWNDWAQYERDIVNAETRPQIIKRMIGVHLAYPTATEFDAFLDKSPASAGVVMGEIGEVAGRRNSGVRKKLVRT